MSVSKDGQKRRRRRGLYVKVASGRGWVLLYPSWHWELLTEEERAAAIRDQTAALSGTDHDRKE